MRRGYDVQGLSLQLCENGDEVKADLRDDFKEEMRRMREDWKAT